MNRHEHQSAAKMEVPARQWTFGRNSVYDYRTMAYEDLARRQSPRSEEPKGVSPGRLRSARLRAGVSTVEAARALGVRRPAIWEMEHGRRRCQPAELATLAELYGVSMTYLLGRPSARARDNRAELASNLLAYLSQDALRRLEQAIAIVRERRPASNNLRW
jgi:transcriptional regulator with XRE-family HTH domain